MDERNLEMNNYEIDVFRVYDYFSEHPIMLISVALSLLCLGAGKILDDNYNKEGK